MFDGKIELGSAWERLAEYRKGQAVQPNIRSTANLTLLTVCSRPHVPLLFLAQKRTVKRSSQAIKIHIFLPVNI